jgi:adenomatosis polyposis coli protein
VFKNEAEMSHSISSVASLELDKVQPPSLLESVNSDPTKSPKVTPSRRRSLPKGLMVRRALSNSLNNGSSLESLENNSLSNLDQVNPPSALGEVLDMESSITSVASLPSENAEVKTDFVINGAVNRNNSLLTSKVTTLFANCSNLNSLTDLENMNPPSLFNEITDLCNSLADVPTEAIASETEMFEDCYTHVLPTEEDVTEFSDANSATPIQSDVGSSSPEVSPKKSKSIAKPMTSKQRRNLARDRYKTYTVAAEMVMREEEDKQSSSEDFKTVDCSSSENYQSVADSQTYSVKGTKMTPREKRQNDRSRFETRVVEEAVTNLLQQPVIEGSPPKVPDSPQSTPSGSPSRTKLSIRRNFMQKRLENKDRFKTQTLNEASFSPELSASPETDLHLMVQREANLVLKSLRETKTTTDELLECETLSLVSNDDDSEQNSGL